MGLNVNDIVLASYRGTCLGQRIILTTTWRVSTPTVGSSTVTQDLQTIGDTMGAADSTGIGYAYINCMPNNYALQALRVQAIYPTRSAYVNITQSYTGLQAEDTDITTSAGVITLKTDKAGRSQVANKHIGPVAQANFSNGNVGSSLRDLMTTLAGKLRNNLVTTGGPILTPVIYHRDGDGPAAKYTDITQYIVQVTLRTMRRRELFLGE